MMARKPLLMILAAVLTLTVRAAAVPVSNSALIVYDCIPGKPTDSKADVVQLQQLLGHFPIPAVLVPMDAYHSGTLFRYRYVFFIGNYAKLKAPESFLRDVRRCRSPFFWINNGVGELGESYLRHVGLRFEGMVSESPYKHVRYKGVLLGKGDAGISLVRVTDPAHCKILAQAIGGGSSVPYVTRSGNFWYVADSPFAYVEDCDRYFAFADLLHDFLGIDHKRELRAIIRIEDVNATSDPDSLRDIADRLHQLRAPFAISLVPRYVNPETNTSTAISSCKGLVDALHYMTAHGGSVVMHGWNHAYHGITADDFEFWDRDRGQPIAEDSPELVRRHIGAGLRILFDSGLYPVAWETPHYTASTVDYREIGRYFSTAVEQRIVLDRFEFGQSFPFEIKRDIYGQRIVPENLGYVAFKHDAGGKEDIEAERREVDEILKSAAAARVLRDASVGAFFHPFLDTELLTRLVSGLRKLGYTFTDLRTETNLAQKDDEMVATGKANGEVRLRGQYLREFYVAPDGTVKRDSFSRRKMTGVVHKSVDVPPGWIYVCRGVRSRPPTWWGRARRRFSLAFLTHHAPEPVVQLARTAVAWVPQLRGDEQNDQAGFVEALGAAGLSPQRVEVDRFTGGALKRANLLVVPHAAAVRLTDRQVSSIVDRVQSGGCLILDGYSKLSERLGIKEQGPAVMVDGAQDVLGSHRFQWLRGEKVKGPLFPSGATVIYRDLHGRPIGAVLHSRGGHCLFLATLLDPVTSMGYGRYPTLPTTVLDQLPLEAGLATRDLELFFDPGYRQNISIERLVLRWKEWGVRAVHAATWHFYPSYSYDYARLIRSCHANGIQVYAWFELPYVTTEFYDSHPEWREKTATGADAHPGWRLPMAIEEPSCRKAVLSFVTDLLKKYDWDGANVSELYFESAQGPDNPAQFVPFHPYVRSSFRSRYGYDPAELFRPNSPRFWRTHPERWRQFAGFRAEMLDGIYRDVLSALRGFEAGDARTGRREIVVTVLDSIGAPEIERNTGLDVRKVLGLMSDGHLPRFTLNVEDPQRMWNDPPDRYRAIGGRYRKLVKDPDRLMLDLNVVEFRDAKERRFASAGPLGTETLEMVRSARSVVPRVLLYCESSIPEPDISLLGVAAASAGSWEKRDGHYDVESPGVSFLRGQDEEDYVAVDGTRSVANDYGEVPVPPGKHEVRSGRGLLEIASREVPLLRFLNASGVLRRLQSRADMLLVDYDSRAPCLVTVDQKPISVSIDGRKADPEILEGTGSWTLRCPSGKHSLVLVGKSSAEYEVEVASALSSYTIVTVGGIGGCLLLGLIIATRFERRVRRKGMKSIA